MTREQPSRRRAPAPDADQASLDAIAAGITTRQAALAPGGKHCGESPAKQPCVFCREPTAPRQFTSPAADLALCRDIAACVDRWDKLGRPALLPYPHQPAPDPAGFPVPGAAELDSPPASPAPPGDAAAQPPPEQEPPDG